MKKLIWTISLFGSSLMSFAQQDSMPKKMMMHDKDGKMMMMHHPNFDKLKTDLGLTDKQVADWKKMEESMKPEMDKMREKNRTEMEAMQKKHQAEMEKMKNQKDEKLKAILSKEQYEKFQKNKPMPKGAKMGMPKHKGPPPPPKN